MKIGIFFLIVLLVFLFSSCVSSSLGKDTKVTPKSLYKASLLGLFYGSIFGLLVFICASKVVVVTLNSSGWHHDRAKYIFYYNAKDADGDIQNETIKPLFGKYIYNETYHPIVDRPIVYMSNPQKEPEYKHQPIVIMPYTLVEVEEMPRYYFETPPNLISIRSKGHVGQSTRWGLFAQ